MSTKTNQAWPIILDEPLVADIYRALIEGWEHAKSARELSHRLYPSQKEVDFIFNVGERFQQLRDMTPSGPKAQEPS